MLRALLSKIGLDKSIAFTASARIVHAGGNLIIVLFIAKSLTPEEQGFYFTFFSVLSMQVFFELGLNGIMTQFVAHEASLLKWKENQYVGSEHNKSRLASLLHFTLKWYSVIAAVLLVVLIVVGFVFFNEYDKSGGAVSWRLPWLILCFSTAANVLIAPLFCILEGLGFVKDVAKYRFYQQILSLLLVCAFLILGAKLLVAAVSSLTWVFVGLIALGGKKLGGKLRYIYKIRIKDSVLYKTEIFPFQWKIALSWISGYFIFQLFNPILFATEGAVVAGQMGMTIAALTAIQSLALSWTSTKVPRYSGYIANKQYVELDTLFNKTIKQAAFITASLEIVFILVISLIRYYELDFGIVYLGDRFLTIIPLLFMALATLMNVTVNAWATYLRCHKQEPFLANSVVGGITCALSTVILGNLFGVIGMTVGYCIITCLLAIWGYNIFKTKKGLWHINQ